MINMKLIKKASLALYKDGDNLSSEEVKALTSILEFLVKPDYDPRLDNTDDYTTDIMEDWILQACQKK